jgi:hypothetical protein
VLISSVESWVEEARKVAAEGLGGGGGIAQLWFEQLMSSESAVNVFAILQELVWSLSFFMALGFVTVATWRSATKYDGLRLWAWLARIATVLALILGAAAIGLQVLEEHFD